MGTSEAEPVTTEICGALDGALAILDRYVVLPSDHERHALALFVAHTWAIEGAHATPYVLIVSPEKRSGKSRLLDVLEKLVARPWYSVEPTAAVLRRNLLTKPTLLVDEVDALFGAGGERTEPLRGVLNAGNRPGATVARCAGDSHQVVNFPIFSPKVLAGIDTGERIPDTIRDRAMTIRMVRKTAAEPTARFRHRDVDSEVAPIRDAFAAWAEDDAVVSSLLDAEPTVPGDLDDRAAEAWEPLLAIADLAGNGWPGRARGAAEALSGGDQHRDEQAIGATLLRAIRRAFGDADRMMTTDLLQIINADEELPFGSWRDGRGLDGRGLARLLKPYDVRPRTIRRGDDVAKGYRREQFVDAWARWAPVAVTVADEVTESSLDRGDVTVVTDVTPNAEEVEATQRDRFPNGGYNGYTVTEGPPPLEDQEFLERLDAYEAALA